MLPISDWIPEKKYTSVWSADEKNDDTLCSTFKTNLAESHRVGSFKFSALADDYDELKNHLFSTLNVPVPKK